MLKVFISFIYKISSKIYFSLYPNSLSFSYKQTQKAPLPQHGSMIAGNSPISLFYYRHSVYFDAVPIIS